MTVSIDYTTFPIRYVGSVKNIREVHPFSEDRMGEAVFEFTDDSSVKDYGKLPFSTPYKGEDLCAMAAQSFRDLEKLGIPTIFKEQIASNALLVDYVRVINPRETDLTKERKNRLIPLECIVRHVITETSSARRRLAKGELHPHSLGLSKEPHEFPCILPKMYMDGSTKLDLFDEYIPWDELKELCKERVEIINQMDIYTRMIGQYSLSKGREIGLIINDFKVEWALDNNGDLILADIPLAIDEITSVYVGQPYQSLDEFKEGAFKIFTPGIEHTLSSYVNVSKQIYRDHYNAGEKNWVLSLETAKEQGLPPSHFPAPPPPPEELVVLASELFGGLRNLWCSEGNRRVKELSESVTDYKVWANHYYQNLSRETTEGVE